MDSRLCLVRRQAYGAFAPTFCTGAYDFKHSPVFPAQEEAILWQIQSLVDDLKQEDSILDKSGLPALLAEMQRRLTPQLKLF